MKVLIVENDKSTLSFIARGLTEKSHVVDVAQDGVTGLQLAQSGNYDAMILERLLPGMTGMAMLSALRESGDRLPVLMLTAMSAVEDRVAGLEAGADDYLVKPFAFSELAARLNAIVRRSAAAVAPTEPIRIADLVVDAAKHKVTRAGKRIDLTQQEFRLLAYLAHRPGEAVTRTTIMEALWGTTFDLRANIVDAHLSRLRAKIDRGFERELLKTVRGVGYLLDDAG